MRNNGNSRTYMLLLTRKKNNLKEGGQHYKGSSQKTLQFFDTKIISYIRIFLRVCSLLNTTIIDM